mgnify:CR=1 FL=1
MEYTKKDIEYAIRKKLIINAKDIFCIPVRIDEEDKIWGIWYTDIDLTETFLKNQLEFMPLSDIIDIQLLDPVDILLKRIGYEI